MTDFEQYFSLAGGTDDSTNHKQPFFQSGMGSRLVILDPELCLTTPEYHWLSSGFRSVDHCVEALCSLEGTPKSDAKAEQGLRLLVPNLLRCNADEKDVDARHQCQMAVILAMDSIRMGIPMGGSHAIGHQLGPLGVAHGITSCVLNPAVMKFNIRHGDEAVAKRQQKVKDILWSESVVADELRKAALDEKTSDLGDAMDVVIRALGLPRSLKEVNVDPNLIPSLSERSLVDFWSPTNPVCVAIRQAAVDRPLTECLGTSCEG
jgi:alcohol dehydrogenase class IV